MSFFSFHFLVFLSVLGLAYSARNSQRYRQWVLSLANLLFLLTFLATVQRAMALVSFLLVTYALLAAIRRGVWKHTTAAGMILAVAFLLFVKRYMFLEGLLPESWMRHAIEFIGVSYMTFKWMHMAVDLKQEQLARVDFLSYANYQIGFFSLAAGPIQRYNGFQQFWQNGPQTENDPLDGLRALNRVLTGLIKIGAFGGLAFLLYSDARQEILTANTRGQVLKCVLLIFYGYPIFLYFNFSGYCDAVIGAARVLGMKHQENFDRPFLARDMIDFWNRWHISLTNWFRDYVFMTSYKWVAERWPSRAQTAGYFLLFLALFLAGLWHGPAKNFVAFGFIQGAGVAVSRWYGDVLKRKLGRDGLQEYLANRWIRWAAIAVTLNYVCFSFLFFVPGARDLLLSVYQAFARVF